MYNQYFLSMVLKRHLISFVSVVMAQNHGAFAIISSSPWAPPPALWRDPPSRRYFERLPLVINRAWWIWVDLTLRLSSNADILIEIRYLGSLSPKNNATVTSGPGKALDGPSSRKLPKKMSHLQGVSTQSKFPNKNQSRTRILMASGNHAILHHHPQNNNLTAPFYLHSKKEFVLVFFISLGLIVICRERTLDNIILTRTDEVCR